jgi:hypothetical protein
LHIQSPGEVPSWVAPLIEALKSLPDTVKSVLIEQGQEETNQQKAVS